MFLLIVFQVVPVQNWAEALHGLGKVRQIEISCLLELNTSVHCSASTGVLKKYGIIWEVGPNGGPHIGNPFFPFSRNE